MDKIVEAIKTELSLESATKFLLFFSKALKEDIFLERFGSYYGQGGGWIISRGGEAILDKKGKWFHKRYGYEIVEDMEEHDINFNLAWNDWNEAKVFVFETKEEANEFAKKTFSLSS